MVSEELLERAAFELLSSSSPARYVRRARHLSGLVRAKERIDTGEISPDELRRWVLERWRYVMAAQQRGREEVELALVLPTLGRRTDDWIRTLFRAMSACDRPGAAWISALARSILRHRSENTTISRETPGVASATTLGSGTLTESIWSDAVRDSSTASIVHAA